MPKDGIPLSIEELRDVLEVERSLRTLYDEQVESLPEKLREDYAPRGRPVNAKYGECVVAHHLHSPRWCISVNGASGEPDLEVDPMDLSNAPDHIPSTTQVIEIKSISSDAEFTELTERDCAADLLATVDWRPVLRGLWWVPIHLIDPIERRLTPGKTEFDVLSEDDPDSFWLFEP